MVGDLVHAFLLIGCVASTGDSGDAGVQADAPGPWSFSLSSELVDFGEPGLDVEVTEIVTLFNSGDEDIILLDVSVPGDKGLHVDVPLDDVAPGEPEPAHSEVPA